MKLSKIKSKLRDLTEISTEPIDVSGIAKSTKYDAMIPIKLADATLSKERVEITVQVGEKKINKKFKHIPIEVKASKGFSYNIRPLYISIIIQGTASVLNPINAKELSAFVDIMDQDPGYYEKKVQVKIPKDTILIETLPTNANIELTREKSDFKREKD